jgi:F-type H+-transporting ATPase subunit b
MVNINFTLIVELTLFLVFLWGANVLAFRPMLRTMDARSAKVADDRRAALSEKQRADELQAKYQRDLLATRRRLNDELRSVRRAEQDKHMQALAERRRELEEQVAAVREELQALVEQERRQYDRLVPQLVEAIDASAGGGRRS